MKPELDLSKDSRVVLRSRDGRRGRELARTRLVVVRVLLAHTHTTVTPRSSRTISTVYF
jgi:hypothetical protein